ncbi:hypothetical protein GGS26DRAFT_323474 [Hypomontagnella submonticulosa]|nr:hypothetical protein GGS26DRAFT_323474 [Hypomontagnella submonticulosa]
MESSFAQLRSNMAAAKSGKSSKKRLNDGTSPQSEHALKRARKSTRNDTHPENTLIEPLDTISSPQPPPPPPVSNPNLQSDLSLVLQNIHKSPRTAFWALTGNGSSPFNWENNMPASTKEQGLQIQYEASLRQNGIRTKAIIIEMPGWVAEEVEKIRKPLSEADKVIVEKNKINFYQSIATLRDLPKENLQYFLRRVFPLMDGSQKWYLKAGKVVSNGRQLLITQLYRSGIVQFFDAPEDLILPKPDMTLGYDRSVIDPNLYHGKESVSTSTAISLFAIDDMTSIFFPFLVVEVTKDNGEIYSAEKQSMNATAFITRLTEQLCDTSKEFIFSLTINSQVATAWVTISEGDHQINSYCVESFLFAHPGQKGYDGCFAFIRDVMEWGFGTRRKAYETKVQKWIDAYVSPSIISSTISSGISSGISFKRKASNAPTPESPTHASAMMNAMRVARSAVDGES